MSSDTGGLGRRLAQAAALGVLLAAVLFGRQSDAPLPGWIDWQSGTAADASGRYEAALRHRAVSVSCDGAVIWKTPRKIKVQEAKFADVDGDGADELILLCWKVGHFGEDRPFWVEEDERTWSQHLFVYTCEDGALRPKWQSSYIGVEAAALSVRGTAGQASDVSDRRQRLVLTDTQGGISSWLWESWGFTREDTDISFVVFGDNLIHEPIYRYGLDKNGGNFDFLFAGEKVRRAIEESDIAVINQETPLAEHPGDYSGYPRFGTPVGVGEAIVEAGFDAVTCATNHALDLGAEGAAFTETFFTSHGVRCLGLRTGEAAEQTEEPDRAYELIARGGARFALFDYTYGLNGDAQPGQTNRRVCVLDDEERIRRQLEQAGAETDAVIVFVHWGSEYASEPDEYQNKWARVFLESGVDVVVGAHPHVLQPCRLLQDDSGHETLVYYSLGNYISAQREASCVKGGAAQFHIALTADGYRVTAYELRPLVITRREDGKYTVDFDG